MNRSLLGSYSLSAREWTAAGECIAEVVILKVAEALENMYDYTIPVTTTIPSYNFVSLRFDDEQVKEDK